MSARSVWSVLAAVPVERVAQCGVERRLSARESMIPRIDGVEPPLIGVRPEELARVGGRQIVVVAGLNHRTGQRSQPGDRGVGIELPAAARLARLPIVRRFVIRGNGEVLAGAEANRDDAGEAVARRRFGSCSTANAAPRDQPVSTTRLDSLWWSAARAW